MGSGGFGPTAVQTPEPSQNHLGGECCRRLGVGTLCLGLSLKKEMTRDNGPRGERQGCEGQRLDSAEPTMGLEGGPLSLGWPDLCHFLPSPDSGYLFSGSRPPSQMSPSGEAPVSGKGSDGEAASVGYPEGCVLNMNLGVRQGLCSNPIPAPPCVQAWASD